MAKPFRNSIARRAWALLGIVSLFSMEAHSAESSPPETDPISEKEFDFDSLPIEEDTEGYETVISGKRPEEEGLSRTRINREEIVRRGVSTAVEVLEQDPAVYARSGKKGEKGFQLRGFDQRGVAVYLDEVPFVLPWDGSADLGKMPAEMLQSVLLLKGPTSIVHGPRGIGGTVLLTTRDPKDGPLIETRAELGGNLETNVSLYGGRDVKLFSYALGVGATLSDGYRLSSKFEPDRFENGGILENSDRHIYHAAAKLSIPVTIGNTLVSEAVVLDGDFGIPRSTTDNRPFFSRFNIWRAFTGQVAHRFKTESLSLEEAFFLAIYSNRLDAYDDATYSTQEGPNAYQSWYRDRTFGGQIHSEYGISGLSAGKTFIRLWLGAEHDIHRSRLDTDEPQNTYRRTLLTLVPEVEIPIVEGLTAMASLQTEVDVPDTGEAEIEDVAERGDETKAVFGPLASVRWDPLSILMFRLSVARSARIPTLGERYSSRLGFTRANPSLDPETAWQVVLDADLQARRWLRFEVSAFDAEVRNMISSEYLPETNGVTQKQNTGSARLAGVEAAVIFEPTPSFRLTAGYAYLYARRLNKSDEEDRVAQIPAHQAVLGMVVTPFGWVSFSSYFRLVGPQAFDDYAILGLGELGTYAVWDARVEVKPLKDVSVWLKGMNLLDMNYQTKYGYPDRGFSFWGGLSCAFY